MYRTVDGLSPAVVDVLLGAYVLGIIPAMLLGGPLSDRFGRRPLMLPAPALAICGSAILAVGASNPAILFVGRVFSGLALGLVMAVGTAWIKELSSPPFDPQSDDGAGARRATLALTTGFGLGAGVAATLAQFGPIQTVLPYLVNIALCTTAWVFLSKTPETRIDPPVTGESLLAGLRVPAAKHRRFLLVVAPAAPWVFGTAATAYAILPGLMIHEVGEYHIAFAGLLCLVALGCGVAIQPLAKRLDSASCARGTVVALTAVVPGMLAAMAAAAWVSVPLSIVAAALLGGAYGLLLVSGLQEIQRIAGPDDLAGLSAVFYSLTYLGFFIPAILAALSVWVSYTTMFLAGALLAALSLGWVSLFWAKHLPERETTPNAAVPATALEAPQS